MADKSKKKASENWSSTDDKDKHLKTCLKEDVESNRTTGFENYYLINNPAPEINFKDIDISCKLFGKQISAPYIILPMTGGTELSGQINRNLAEAAQELHVAMGVGSQRLGIEKPSLAGSFQVREVAPDIPLFANLGAVYLNYGYGLEECERLVEMIGADALTLYLNPMQKLFQGDRAIDFKGLIEKIAHICRHLSVPVIVKEVGFGLSADSALLLKKAGVDILDVAGAGGTSWVKITRHLKGEDIGENSSAFDDWGIPAADSLISVKGAVPDMPVIASGGIRSGNDMAKALALGADYTGMALPLLSHALQSSEAVINKIVTVIEELKIAMFGCGVANLRELKEGQFIRHNMG